MGRKTSAYMPPTSTNIWADCIGPLAAILGLIAIPAGGCFALYLAVGGNLDIGWALTTPPPVSRPYEAPESDFDRTARLQAERLDYEAEQQRIRNYITLEAEARRQH